ncbi:low molecular weight phosphatase family protein [Bradyrhizobium roseum]|uniref:low molecular weight phosphatase family protein n=1 Tax=Bradyrhizobium roseum TaxID=3056648 RepID=UPI0026278A68|nr:low molecular weight phosphatase family protein [Bradyrhizobium roseus]WKA30542.1 low molecular weight phosphatase family protein [Bradyrhizobium roseus]
MKLRQVLFLCTGNYYRSRFAEEMFNHEARIAGLNWRASSRGLATEPSPDNVGAISTFALQALNDRSISPAERFPVVCTIDDLEAADRVIALKEAEHRLFLAQRFPEWENRTSYWHVDDIDVAEPADAIAKIDQLVRELIKDCQDDNR